MSRQDEQPISTLIEQCRSGDSKAQITAMYELEELDAREAVPAILPLLESCQKMVRSVAAEALGMLGDEHVDEIGPRLEKLLADPAEYARGEAAQALGALRYTPARAAIERLLLHDEDWVVRATAAEALGDLGDVGAMAALERALADEYDPVRGYTSLAIGLVGDGTHLPIVRRQLALETNPINRAELLVAALRLGDQAALDELLALLCSLDDNSTGDTDGVGVDGVGVFNAVEDMLRRRIPPVIVERGAELDQALVTFGGSQSLRERLAKLVHASSPAQP